MAERHFAISRRRPRLRGHDRSGQHAQELNLPARRLWLPSTVPRHHGQDRIELQD